MKIRARVDLSPRWRAIALSMFFSILLGIMLKPLAGQLTELGDWRRTVHGWEHAHAIQSIAITTQSSTGENPSHGRTAPWTIGAKMDSTTSSIGNWHCLILPIAVCSFFVSFGCWLLIGVPNHGIVRRLDESA